MYAFSAAVDVNPKGARPVLTQDQVWRGLVMKAENAVAFVPGISSCIVLERYEDGLLREVVLRGTRFRERVTYTPQVKVHFLRVGTEDHAGWITNVISESERGLILTFTYAVNFAGTAPGSAEEKQAGTAMRSTYLGAVTTALATVRRLVEEGKL